MKRSKLDRPRLAPRLNPTQAIARAARATVEPMEARRLLAGITINGTANPDTIAFNGTSYTLNGVVTAIGATVDSVIFNGLGSADTINVNSLRAGLPVTVNTGTGTDATTIGNGDLDTILSDVTVNGGAISDNDLLTINNATDQVTGADESWSIRATSMETKDRTYTYSNVQRIVANQSNNPSFNSVREVDAGLNVTINGNAGNDMYEVGDSDLNPEGGVIDNIRGKLTINAGTNAGAFGDSFSFNNFNKTSSSSYVLTNTVFTSPSNAAFLITYSGFEDMNINLSPAAERFDATTRTGGATWMLGGGADTIFGTAAPDTLEAGDIATGVEIHGGGGSDAITGSDSSDQLFGDAGADVITSGGGFDTIDGGAGNDTMEATNAFDTYVFTPATVPETDEIQTTVNTIGTLDFSAITTPVTALLRNRQPDLNGFVTNFVTHANRTITISGPLDNGGFDAIQVNGGSGNDTLVGGASTSALYGNAGNDTIEGGPNTFTLEGGADNDTLTLFEGSFGSLDGGTGNDSLIGTTSGETILGGEDNDTLVGNGGADELSGDTGDDTYVISTDIGTGSVIINELIGGGTDTVDFSTFTTSVAIDLRAPDPSNVITQLSSGGSVIGTNIENATGGSNNDTITGDDGPNTLVGGPGNDAILGNGGSDRLRGGTNDDVLFGDEGDDVLIGDEGNDFYRFNDVVADETDTIIEFGDASGLDWLDFGTTNDPVDINLGSEQAATQFGVAATRQVVNIFNDLPSRIENAFGGSSADIIIGSDAPNLLSGGRGPDTITGGFGDDTINGGTGSDELRGQAGNDRYAFGTTDGPELDLVEEADDAFGIDALDFSEVTTPVSVNLASDGIATHFNREVVTITGGSFVNFEQATGGSAGDTLIGNNANNTIVGGSGADSLRGENGADSLQGDGGNDTFVGGAGSDTLVGGGNDDLYRFGGAVSPTEADRVSEAAGGGTDTLDFSALPSPGGVVVNLLSDTLATHTNRVLSTLVAGQAPQFENVIGSISADNITGNNANNTIVGGSGADSLRGENGSDSLVGDAGNDTFVGGAGSDTLVGGGNDDLYRFGGAVSPTEADRVSEAAGGGTDTLDFSALPAATGVVVNLLSDTLATHTNRVLSTLVAGQAPQFENVIGSISADNITGNNANNTIVGGSGADSLRGENGSDSLVGDAGNDTFVGGAGSDTLVGGGNDDLYRFGGAVSPTEADRVSEAAGGGTDTLDFSALPAATGVVVNLLSDTLATHTNRVLSTLVAGQAPQFENVIGSISADNITGNAANNTIVGGLGNDTLTGGLGLDRLDGGDNNDTFFARGTPADADTILGGAGSDSLQRDTLDSATLVEIILP